MVRRGGRRDDGGDDDYTNPIIHYGPPPRRKRPRKHSPEQWRLKADVYYGVANACRLCLKMSTEARSTKRQRSEEVGRHGNGGDGDNPEPNRPIIAPKGQKA